MKSKKAKLGSFSIAVTLLFIAGVVLLNVLAGQLTDRFFLKADLTAQSLYTLSEQTENALKDIDSNVKITVLGEETLWMNDIRNRLAETLNNYSAISGGAVSVTYVDTKLNPQLKEQYPLLPNLTDGDIVIESGKRYKSVNWMDLFEWSYDESYNYIPTTLNAEQELTSSILYVVSDDIARAVFLEGHDEGSSTEFKALLEKANYECQTVNLGFDEIPDGTTLLICAAPKNDFLASEIERLDAYMKSGGDAMIFYDLDTPRLEKLDLYLEEWGISVESKMILDAQYNYGIMYAIAGTPVKTADGILPSLSGISSGSYLVMNTSRPVKTLWATGERNLRKTIPLINSMQGSYAKVFSEETPIQSAEKAAGDDDGPFALGVLSQDTNSETANMFVLNYGLMEDNALKGSTYYFNAQMLGLIANDLNTSGQSVIIEGKSLAGTVMTVMPYQSRLILIFMVIIMPVLILGAGVVVWRKRKRL